MLNNSVLEIENIGEVKGLARRILSGEVVVLRGGLQQLGLYDTLVEASLEGIHSAVGEDISDKVKRNGFDRIHEWVDPSDLPVLTDAVYHTMTTIAPRVLERLVPRVFPDGGTYYFERSPNVRFHIPYDLAAKHRQEFDKFSQKRGQGKISAHGPHRDPWVDCPDNGINVWIAVGPVRRGNGLTVFAKDYQTEFAFKDGYIDAGARLHKPLTFDLQPGDVLLFHTNHLHGSQLNRTDRTRYVVSYRLTFGKPHYPHGHYHHYLHAGLAGGRWRWLAGLPQNFQMSFFLYQWRRLRYKIIGRGRMSGADGSHVRSNANGTSTPEADGSMLLADFPVGSIHAVSKSVCIARFGESEFAAVSRRCPHMGGDLVGGWIDDGELVCPLHSLTFNPRTGASPCSALKPLRRLPWYIRGNRVYLGADQANNSPEMAVPDQSRGSNSSD